MLAVPRAIVEVAMNRALALSPATQSDLFRLAGKKIKLEIRDIGLRGNLLIGSGKIHLLEEQSDFIPDATICLTSWSAGKLAVDSLAANPSRGPPSEVEISGDTDVARRFKSALDNIQIDWEEELAQRVGDVLAQPIETNLRNIANWFRATAQTATQDIAEFLQHESRQLPLNDEIERFAGDVDRLRDDTERLAARVARLQREADIERATK